MANSNEAWQTWLHAQNRIWREYRVEGSDIKRSLKNQEALYRHFEEHGNPPLPNEERLLFFENHNWTPQDYRLPFSVGGNFSGQPDDIELLSRRDTEARARYSEMKAYFGQPRYVAQKVLGVGGNGIAAHFIDRGPGNANVPERDIVIKASLIGGFSHTLAREKKMMRVSCLIKLELGN